MHKFIWTWLCVLPNQKAYPFRITWGIELRRGVGGAVLTKVSTQSPTLSAAGGSPELAYRAPMANKTVHLNCAL